jgi:hypothetical protein
LLIAPTIASHAGPELPKGRDHHVTFVVAEGGGDGAFLYVAGGITP